MKRVLVSASLDDLRFPDYRFLEEASKLGALHVLLWSDETIQSATGRAPKFPLPEREYTVQAIRYTHSFSILDGAESVEALARVTPKPEVWVVPQSGDTPARRDLARRAGLEYRVIPESVLQVAPPAPPVPVAPQSAHKKVIVTGCYDWFHSGHIRFFEEVSELGDLYVCVGHDANIKLLKGEGHPLFPDTQRRFIAGSIRYVKEALISTGNGWMDAEPEIYRIKPDIYAVNEDGDKPDKREFCEKHHLEYRVLKRLPKPGLTRRQSTSLRGF
jgi:cytidyltransferase-like protein